MSVFDPTDPTVSPGTFAWAECGRFWTAPKGPLYPLLGPTISAEKSDSGQNKAIEARNAKS
jgi:hypothetical protein